MSASFSVIVPAYGDFPGLCRTLVNLGDQTAPLIEREVLVVYDGHSDEAEEVCGKVNEAAKIKQQNMKIQYLRMDEHSGTGNIPRAEGLRRATRDWVMFVDQGTSVCNDCFEYVASAIHAMPDVRLLVWNIVQLCDPSPWTTRSHLIHLIDRPNGLPYMIPGIAAALRREIAQQVPWPNVRESDWAYFSQVWEVMFGPPPESDETKQRIEREVMTTPITLMVAYGARTERKYRELLTENFNNSGREHGWGRS